MLRFVVRTDNCAHVVHGGASAAEVTLRSFEIDAPELEVFLREKLDFVSRTLVGVEYFTAPPSVSER